MKTRFVAAAIAALSVPALAYGGAPASAQNAPAGYATPYPVPSLPPGSGLSGTVQGVVNAVEGIVGGSIAHALNSNVGTVTYYKGYTMQIEVAANRYETVHLFHGTTIDPRGETIRIGDTVDVGGRKEADGSLDANAITIRH